jgi:hypothetical protein
MQQESTIGYHRLSAIVALLTIAHKKANVSAVTMPDLDDII